MEATASAPADSPATESPSPIRRGWTLEEAYEQIGVRAVTPHGKVRIIGSITRNRETGDMELGIFLIGKKRPGDPRWVNLPPDRIVDWKFQDKPGFCGVEL